MLDKIYMIDPRRQSCRLLTVLKRDLGVMINHKHMHLLRR